MASSTTALTGLVLSLLFLLLPSPALAGFQSKSQNNIAIYWGQNSASRADSQKRLAYYCTNSPATIIPIAFLNSIKSPTLVNFASASDSCAVFPGTQLLDCPEIAADIERCKSQGKTILLSLGGATYTEGGFSSSAEAISWAETLWAMFGPPPPSSSARRVVNRPFGLSVIDGFDFDFEATTRNTVPFALRLRELMDASSRETNKKYLLSAAPQCPFPDHAMDDLLRSVPLDFVSIQFYNNYCGAPSFPYSPSSPSPSSQSSANSGNFNFAQWDTWAAKASPNPNVKLLLGVPGSPSAAGTGYVTTSQLDRVVMYARQFPSFGGVMVWDMSQAHGNAGFVDGIVRSLSGSGPPIMENSGGSGSESGSPLPVVVSGPGWTTVTTTAAVAAGTGTGTTTDGLVSQWGQCGGKGYSGSRVCRSPYSCVQQSEWWSHCN